MIIIKVCNQRSWFYIRVNGISTLGYVWQKLSEKGYFKLCGFYDLSDESKINFFDAVRREASYFDSLDAFLAR